MTDAVVVISRPQLRTCHSIMVGFLRAAGRTVKRVRVRLSDTSGVAVDEKIWFNDSTDAIAIAEEVAHHITSSASGRSDLEAITTVSDAGAWSLCLHCADSAKTASSCQWPSVAQARGMDAPRLLAAADSY
jgi:hypothetical protein